VILFLIMKTKKKPSVAIVACIHGDEIAGKYVIGELKKRKDLSGDVGFFIAHPRAVAKKKRFLVQDLNRSFPGKKFGNVEEKIAYSLQQKLRYFDFVIDIHTTNSKIDKLAIVTSLSVPVRNLLKSVPIKKVALVTARVLGGKQLGRYHRAAVSLEYGPDKSGKNYKIILGDVLVILRNLGLISGPVKIISPKELYRVSGVYKVNKSVTPLESLRDFKLIKKGEVVGRDNKGRKVFSKKSFYPLFVGSGRYSGTLALVSSRRNFKS